MEYSLQNTPSFQYTACASPTANLTIARLAPVAVFGKLVIGISKWEAPESHIANGSPGSPISTLWMVLSPRLPGDNA
eukprot:900155-Prorocentrum_lima.AAC.1